MMDLKEQAEKFLDKPEYRELFHTDGKYDEDNHIFFIEMLQGFAEQSLETGQVDAIVNGTRYTERQFLERAVRHAKPRGAQDGVPIEECPRWVAVRDAFGFGSTYAVALSREFDLDPEEILTKSYH